jgi:hypothetical protein
LTQRRAPDVLHEAHRQYAKGLAFAQAPLLDTGSHAIDGEVRQPKVITLRVLSKALLDWSCLNMDVVDLKTLVI